MIPPSTAEGKELNSVKAKIPSLSTLIPWLVLVFLISNKSLEPSSCTDNLDPADAPPIPKLDPSKINWGLPLIVSLAPVAVNT